MERSFLFPRLASRIGKAEAYKYISKRILFHVPSIYKPLVRMVNKEANELMEPPNVKQWDNYHDGNVPPLAVLKYCYEKYNIVPTVRYDETFNFSNVDMNTVRWLFTHSNQTKYLKNEAYFSAIWDCRSDLLEFLVQQQFDIPKGLYRDTLNLQNVPVEMLDILFLTHKKVPHENVWTLFSHEEYFSVERNYELTVHYNIDTLLWLNLRQWSHEHFSLRVYLKKLFAKSCKLKAMQIVAWIFTSIPKSAKYFKLFASLTGKFGREEYMSPKLLAFINANGGIPE